MLEDFKRALARVQSDYGFYIDCQVQPAMALAGYDLSPDERSALIDPEKLADVLKRGVGISRLPSITIKISGTHDWVNRAVAMDGSSGEEDDRSEQIGLELEAIKRASSDDERAEATVRLMELIG